MSPLILFVLISDAVRHDTQVVFRQYTKTYEVTAYGEAIQENKWYGRGWW